MAAQDFYIREGDTKDDLQVTLRDANDAAVDVTGATIVFSMWGARDRRIKVKDGSLTLVTPASGVVKYPWATDGTETNESGEFEGEFEVAYAAGAGIQTFPNNRANVLRVHIEKEIA